jgi:hypothetical protein
LSHKRSINWRRLIRALHRDIGYLCIGLTIVFAVSGVALNHLRDWNPNYIVERQQKAISFDAKLTDQQINTQLLELFPNASKPKTSYWQSVNSYKLFFDGGGTIHANFKTNKATFEHITARPVFKQFNRLHLNEAHNGWIVFSDIYAGLLIFLALSSLFMVKGKYGPFSLNRGWLVILGGAIPAFYIFF